MLKWILGFVAFIGLSFAILPAEHAKAQFNGGGGNEPFTAPGLWCLDSTGTIISPCSGFTFSGGVVTTSTVGDLTVTGTVSFLAQNASSLLFTDASKNASTTLKIPVDGGRGYVSSTRFIVDTVGSGGGFFNINSGIQSAFYNVAGTGPYIGAVSNHALTLYSSNSGRWQLQASNYHFVPLTDNLYNLGSQSLRVAQGHFVHVSSTNVTTTRLYTGAPDDTAGITMITGSNLQLQNDAVRGILTSDNSLGTCMYYSALLAGGVCASGTTVVLSAGSAAIADFTSTGFTPRSGYTALSLGSFADPWARVHASSTVGSSLPSMVVTGTLLLPAAYAGNSAVEFSSETGGTERAGINLSNFGNLNLGWRVGNRSINIMNNGSGIFSFTGTSNPVFNAAVHNTADLGTTANYFRTGYINSVSSTSVTTTRIFTGADGTAASGITFGNANIGAMYCNVSGLCSLNTAGSLALQIGSASVLFSRHGTPVTNDTYDLGATTLYWLNGYIRNVSSTRGMFMEYVTSSRLALASGSLSEPSLNFGNSATPDANTGIYQSSANSLDFVANGSRFMKIASGGVSVGADATPLLPLADGTVDFGDTSTWWDKAFIRQVNASSSVGSALDVLSTSGTVKMFGIAALGASGDFVCYNNTVVGAIQKQNANCTVSSAYFKNRIESLSSSEMAALVRKLRAVEYDQKAYGRHELGFIAEEVARIEPSLVVYVEPDATRLAWVKKNYPDVVIVRYGKTLVPQTVDYMRFTSVLTGAWQDLDERLAKLENRVGILERLAEWVRSTFKK